MTAALSDRFGRVATDLRVSVTDRCNLRCRYCMPAEGLDWLPDETQLTDAELIRLMRIGVELLGIRSIRFTGGEPLLRKGIIDLVASAASLGVDVSMTTNGLGLAHLAEPLRAAGLARINVSLDTLRRDRFAELTRRDRFTDVIAGLEAARDAGHDPIKVNAVLMRGINDDEAIELLEWAMANDYKMRFIEQMPLDPHSEWDRSKMVTADEILATISLQYDLAPVDGRGSAPAEEFRVTGTSHTVGIIGSVTRPFCADCDRSRLTSDGQVRDCLFALTESDLRTPLRAGASDDELAQRWVVAMRGKRAGHGIDRVDFLQPARPMSAIGG